MKAKHIACIAILLTATATAAERRYQEGAGKQDQNSLKITADLVQMDVLVTDQSGKPVRGLRREDFELFDDHMPQRISHFGFEETRPLKIGQGTTEFRGLPRVITQPELRRVIAFVVDTLHMKPGSVYNTQKIVTNFIESKMQPGDLVLVLPTTGGTGLYQQFTSDRRILARATADLRPFVYFTASTPHRISAVPAAGSAPLPGASIENLELNNPVAGDRSRPIAARGNNRAIGSYIDPEESADIKASLYTLNNLIQYMNRLPGRKLTFFVSEGMRLFQTQTEPYFRDTIDRAQRSNVVFYTLDPRGLDPVGISASDELFGLPNIITHQTPEVTTYLNAQKDDYYDSQDSLSALASETGGKFFHDSNDLSRGLDVMLEENSAYYVLGFQPEGERWDGKLHKIKITVPGRPDLRVSARKTYLARIESPAKPKTAAESHWAAETEAITSPLVRRDIDLQLTPFYRDDKNRKPVFMALLHVGVSKLNLVEVEGRRRDRLELVGFILDSKGKIIDIFGQDIDLNMSKEAYDRAVKDGFLCVRTLGVKPGAYQMRVLVRERETGSIGTAQNYIEVPDLKGKNLAISSIVTDVDASQTGTGRVDSENTLSQRRFHRGSQFNYTVAVYNARQESHGNEPQLAIRTRIMAGPKEVYKSDPRPARLMEGSTPPSRVLVGGTLSLGKLPAGDYTLEVTVSDRVDKKASRGIVRQELDFAVE
jgi:VWFA-related protein